MYIPEVLCLSWLSNASGEDLPCHKTSPHNALCKDWCYSQHLLERKIFQLLAKRSIFFFMMAAVLCAGYQFLSQIPSDSIPFLSYPCLKLITLCRQLLFKDWPHKELFLPMLQEQYCDNLYIFQHDGAPSHKAKVITQGSEIIKWTIWIHGQKTDCILIWLKTLWSVLKRWAVKHKLVTIFKQWWGTNGSPSIMIWPRSYSTCHRKLQAIKKKIQLCKYWLFP